MPVLARFYGIIIRMYFLQSEHNPPHIHAIYGEDMAAIDIQTGSVVMSPYFACEVPRRGARGKHKSTH